jgi:hypothetical protein
MLGASVALCKLALNINSAQTLLPEHRHALVLRHNAVAAVTAVLAVALYVRRSVSTDRERSDS